MPCKEMVRLLKNRDSSSETRSEASSAPDKSAGAWILAPEGLASEGTHVGCYKLHKLLLTTHCTLFMKGRFRGILCMGLNQVMHFTLAETCCT